MGYGKVNFTSKGFKAGFFTNILERRRGEPAHDRHRGQADRLRLPDQDVRLRGVERPGFKDKHVVTYGGNLRFNTFDLSLAPTGREPHRRRRLHPGRDLPVADVPPGRRRARRSLRLPRRLRVLAARHLHGEAAGRTTRIRVSYNRAYRSPSVINNFLDVTIAEPLNARRVLAAAGGRHLSDSRSARSATPDLNETLGRRLRDRLQRRRRQGPRDRLGGLLRQQGQGRHLLHRADRAALDARPTRRRAGRCRRP